jgi:hypothetical protein
VDRLADAVARVGTGPSLAALAAAQDLATVAGEAMQQAVDEARAAGHSWREIGDVLGTTRQAAFQRFGHPVDPRTGAPMSTKIAAGAADRAVAILASMTEGHREEARHRVACHRRSGPARHDRRLLLRVGHPPGRRAGADPLRSRLQQLRPQRPRAGHASLCALLALQVGAINVARSRSGMIG